MRSTEIDYALFITRKLAATFPDLKIILVSATLHKSLFTEYFRKELAQNKVADPYFVGIKRFPVKVVFIDQLDKLASAKEDEEQCAAMTQLQILARKLEKNAAQLLPYAPEVTPFTEEVCINLIISQPSPGDAVLIFHSGLGDMNEFCNSLHKKLLKLGVRDRYRLFIFHPRVQNKDQDEAFQESLKRTIIVTNRGVESSLTIPNLRLVINFGINKEMMYNSAKRISELSRQWCSHASCIQREGRVGRVSEGTAVHLFTKEFYETLPDFGPPEIIRVPLAKTFLRAKGNGPQLGIPLPSRLLSMVIEPPSFVQFSTALHDLAEYGAIAHSPHHKISEEADVTLLGKFSLSLPLDLNLCRLVLLGILFGCPLDGIVIAAATAMYQDVFSMPMKVVMNDLHRFCHSLTTSTFFRMRYDDGYYSNPIMILNMFIDWLKYKSSYPHTSRRELAIRFQKAIKPGRLLHLEDFVGDIARCVANCICQDTVLYSELQTLSRISMENKGEPVFGEFPSQPVRKSWEGNTGLLHFCNNCVILKALIAAAAPDEILCGERACESSHPYSRTFAQKCINVIENKCFSLSHTLCMDLSKLDKKQMQEIDEAVFEKLFKNFPSEFQLSVESKVVKDIAVLHFQSDPSLTLTKTAQSCTPRQRKSSTADISEIPPEVNFFWRFGEQMTLWEIDEVDALFPAPSHPCALMWYRFDESKSQVDTVNINFRNPTGFVCKYDKPSQPYFAVATGAFLSGGNILAPRLTVLPCMPTSLMMVLAFQHSTSTIEFLVNKTTINGIKLNSVEIPCTDIENYISKDEIGVINQLRRAISNAMALTLNDGCIPLYDPSITSIPRLLHDLLSSCKPNISKSTTSNLQTLSMDDRRQGLVWELITPGKSLKDQSTSKFSYYAEFKCSLLGSKPYAVKEVYHDRKPPLSPFPIEYTQSVSAELLAESKEIHKKGRLGALNDFSTFSESLKVYKKVKRVEAADLRKKDKQRAKKQKGERKDLSTVSESLKVYKKMKRVEAADLRVKDRQTAKKMKKCERKDLSTFSESLKVYKKVKRVEAADLRVKDKQRAKKKKESEKKERKRAKKEALSLFYFSSPLFLTLRKEKVNRGEEAEDKKRERRMRKGEKKERKRTRKETTPLSPPSSPLFLYPSSPSLLEADIDEMVESMEETYLREEDKIKKKIIRKREKKEKRKAEKKAVQIEKALLPLPPKLPIWPVSEQVFLHDQDRMMLSENCPKIRKKQDLDAQIVTTSKQKLPTESDDAGLENSEGGLLKPKSIIPNNGNCKQTVSRPLTTTTLFGEKRKLCLATAKGNPNVRNESKKPDSMTRTKTANRCQSQVEHFKVQKPLKELAVSGGSFTKQKAANKVALIKHSAQPSKGEHMAQLHDGFNRECGGQSRLKKESSLNEIDKVQEEEETTLRVVREKETVLMLKEREKSESFLSEERIGREKIQNQREATLSNLRVEQAAIKEEERRGVAIREEGVGSEKEDALKGKEEERKAAMSEKRVKRRKEQDKDEDQKEGEVSMWEAEKVKRDQATVKGNGKVKSEKADLMPDNMKRQMQNRRNSDEEKERDKEGVSLGTTNSEQELPAQSGIAGPTTSDGNQIWSVISVSQFLPDNGKHQAAIKGINPLEDEEKKSLTTSTGNPNVSDESKVTGTETRTKNENSCTELMTTTANRCQSQVEVLRVSHTKEPLKETAVSDISSTKHKAASKIAPNKITAEHSTCEHMAEFLVSFINECGGQTKPGTLMPEKKETAFTEKERGEIEKKEATLKENGKVKTEEEDLMEEEMRREKQKKRNNKKVKERERKEVALVATNSEQEPHAHSGIAEREGRLVASVSQIVPTNGNSKQTVSDSLTAPKGTHLCKHQEKRTPTAATGNLSIPDKNKKTGPETLITGTDNTSVPNERKNTIPKTQMSENSITESMTVTANRCQSEVDVLKVSDTKEPLKETAVSKITSTKHKAASGIAAQHSAGEHMAEFLVGFINECGGQTKPGTLMQEEKETALTEKERVEVEKKEATLKGNGKVKTEEEYLMEEDRKREKQKRRKKKKVKERENKEVALVATNSEQETPAHSGMAEPEGRLVVSVSQIVPTNGNSKQTVSDPLTAPKGTNLCKHQEKRSWAAATGNPSIPDEGKKTGPETKMKTKMSEKGSTEAVTESANRCQSEVEVLKMSHTMTLKEMAVSDISSTKQKATSKVAQNILSAQHSTCEHMAQFPVDSISECGGQTILATLREGAPLREKCRGHKDGGAALNEKEKVEAKKEASLKVKGKERVERRKDEKDKVQKERQEVVLCEKKRVEGEKATTLKDNQKVKREQEAGVREDDQQREKRKAKRNKKEKNERENKEATLAATISEQKPSTQTGTAGPETSEGRSVVSVSQIVPTNGNGKQAVCKPIAASMGTQLSECQEKRSLITGTDNTSVPNKRKNTIPKTEILENVSANRCQSEVDVLKVSDTKEPLKETAVSDISSTKHKAASNKIVPNKMTAQHSTGEHMPEFLVSFISECGRQTRPATLMNEAPLKDKDKMQEEKETALTEERVEIEKKEATLKGNGKVKEDLMEEERKREKQKRRNKKKVKERERKEVVLAATNSEQEPHAHFGIAEPEGRLVVSVSQIIPTSGNSKQTVSDPLTAPKGTNLCKHQEKRSWAAATGNPSIPDEGKKTGPETKMKTKMSEKGSIEVVTESANRCQSEVEVLKISHTMNPLKEMAVSDISPTKQKATSKVAPNELAAQHSTCEHIVQFPVDSISECGGQTKLATLGLMEGAPLREKGRVHKDGGTALDAKERVEAKKEASLKVKGKERVERRKEEVPKEREVILCKKMNVEREKATTLKDNKKVKREQEAGVTEEDQQREKRKAKRNKKEKNGRERKEATLAATISEQEPSTQTGTAGPETSEGRSVLSVSQIVPTNGNGEQAVCKPIAASMGTQLSECQEKRSLITGTDNTSVPNERKNTIPKTQISANGIMTLSTNRCQSEVEVLKVTHTMKPLKETVVSDSSSTEQKAASKVAPHRITAQPGTGKHMAQFLVDFINECGGQTRLATLRREALSQYQEKYHWHYTHLSRGFLRKCDCFEISEDSSGVCHVRVVGAQRQSLGNTEPEKMEHKTKKSLFYKSFCDIKMRYSSEDTCVLEGDFASFPGSPEHIVEYLHNYLSSHFFPYGCPVSSLDALYQKEYRPRCSHPVVPMINAKFLKEFSSYFVLEVGRTFVKLKEGVDHSDTSQLKGSPYTPQHVNDYFRRYLAQEGVVCTQQLRVLFSECYMKEFKMPQDPIIHFIREDFFKRSCHLFVTFTDIVVFRK